MPTLDPKTYERAYARAVAYVRRRMQGQPWAESDLPEEIAAQAMLASFDPKKYPWRRDKPLEHHIVLVTKSVLHDRGRAAKLRAKPENAAAADEAAKRSALPADALVTAAEREARRAARIEAILAQLEGLDRDVFLLEVKDVFDPAQQAEVLRQDIQAIYRARHRVAKVVRNTPAEPESSPEMASLESDDARDDEDDYDGDDREDAP